MENVTWNCLWSLYFSEVVEVFFVQIFMRAPDLKLLKMEVLFGLGISNSWQVSWSLILIGWLTVTLRLEVQTQALAICVSVAVNLLKYEFEFLVLCWESYVINLNKGGGILFWGGLLMQLVAADTDSGITQILKRSSCPGCKFDGHLCILIIEVGVEEFPNGWVHWFKCIFG